MNVQSGRNSVVECGFPKADVVGSNPIARSLVDRSSMVVSWGSRPMGGASLRNRPRLPHRTLV